MKYVLLCFCFTLCLFQAIAQKGVFKWETELCEHKGLFDSLKIKRNQIQGAHALTNSSDMSQQPYFLLLPSVYSIEDLKKVDTGKISENYYLLKQKFQNIKLPASTAWENYRTQQIKAIEENYKMGKVLATAFVSDNYTGIAEFKDKCSTQYTEALQAGGDKLLDAWKNLVNKSAKNNGDPKRVITEYEQKLNTPEKYLHAKVEILTFGWSNCVSATIKGYDGTNATIAFRKLFKSVKDVCSE
jgi:hypothetical protein